MAVTPIPWDTLTLEQKVDWLCSQMQTVIQTLEQYKPLLDRANKRVRLPQPPRSVHNG